MIRDGSGRGGGGEGGLSIEVGLKFVSAQEITNTAVTVLVAPVIRRILRPDSDEGRIGKDALADRGILKVRRGLPNKRSVPENVKIFVLRERRHKNGATSDRCRSNKWKGSRPIS